MTTDKGRQAGRCAQDPVERLALSADRARLASVAHDSTLRLWDLGFLHEDDTGDSGDEADGEPAAAAAGGARPGDGGPASPSARPHSQALMAPAAAINGARVRGDSPLWQWCLQKAPRTLPQTLSFMCA